MLIGVPKEFTSDEKRVALTPAVAEKIIKLGYELVIESGAGAAADYADAVYEQAGVRIENSADKVLSDSDIILKVRPVTEGELAKIKRGATVIGFFNAAQNEAFMKKAAAAGVNLIAMESVPRISRAQKMDALSSQANIGGYRAVIEAASLFGRFFTGQVTAAGKVPPAKVLVIGVGVAGLQAIGTAKNMGAIVRAFDVRPEVAEQVESLGADFLMLEFEEDGAGEGGYAKIMSDEFIAAEMALFAEQAKEVDIILTIAAIPNRPAPKLITKEMVASMKPGSVIVDMAAETGGNCEVTKAGELFVTDNGVKVIGYTDLPSRLANVSSQLYATNLFHMLSELTPEKDGAINIDFDDEVIRSATVVKEGDVTWPAPPVQLAAAPAAKPAEAATPQVQEEKPKMSESTKNILSIAAITLATLGFISVGRVAPESFMTNIMVFILASFVGYRLIWDVKSSLHTPLMSLTNAISGIVIVGAILLISSASTTASVLATLGVLIAMINVVGGFFVTRRMLNMFKK